LQAVVSGSPYDYMSSTRRIGQSAKMIFEGKLSRGGDIHTKKAHGFRKDKLDFICVSAHTAFLESHPLHKTIHHPLFAGVVELDGQLVAVHGGHVAGTALNVIRPASFDFPRRGRTVISTS
jgi:hypothetical protein